MRSLCSVSLELLGEPLSDRFLLVSIKADGGSSVEVPSSAGSVFSNASALLSKSLRKLKSRLDTPPVPSSFSAWSGYCCIGSSDRRLPPCPSSPSGFSFEFEGPCSSLPVPSGNFGMTSLPADRSSSSP